MKVILSQMSLRACETLKPFALSLSISPVLFPNTPRARSDNCDNRPPAAGVGRAAPGGPRQHRAVKLGRKQALGTFACHLLMPFDDYRAQLGDAEISGVLLTHITDRYGVSLTAAVRRWIEFTDKRAAIVVARDGFALWGGASKAAYRSGIFINSGLEIPEKSLVGMGRRHQRCRSADHTAAPGRNAMTLPPAGRVMLVTINPTRGYNSPGCHSTFATTRRGLIHDPA